MRVLLVQSDNGEKQPLFPLGLSYMATALSYYGHEASIYDTNVSTDPNAELRKLIRNLEPEIIGVGMRNFERPSQGMYRSYVQSFIDLVSMLKEAAPASKIIAGGAGYSIYARQLLERISALDFGIVLEGEESMPELLNNLDEPQSVKGIFYRRNGSIQFTGAREPIDFSNFPAPRRDLVNLTPYLENPFSISVQTKRGCAFRCAYCTYPYLEGANLRLRPAQAVLDELEELVKENGLKTFYFVDSIFNVPQSHAHEICEGMLARGLGLHWKTAYNARFVDKEHMKLARDAGCRCFDFSPDGFSQSTLTALKKDITTQDIHKVYSLVKQIDGVQIGLNFFINSPGDSLGNLFRLIFFMLKLKLILRRKVAVIDIATIRIYPHTPIHALAVKKGMVKEYDDILEPVFYNPAPLCYILRMMRQVRRLVLAVISVMNWLVRSFSDLPSSIGSLLKKTLISRAN